MDDVEQVKPSADAVDVKSQPLQVRPSRPDASDGHHGKKNRVGVACDPCRARRSKCSFGANATACTACSQRGTACTYGERVDKRRLGMSIQELADLEEQKTMLQDIVQAVQTCPSDFLDDLVSTIRNESDTLKLANYVYDLNSRKQSQLSKRKSREGARQEEAKPQNFGNVGRGSSTESSLPGADRVTSGSQPASPLGEKRRLSAQIEQSSSTSDAANRMVEGEVSASRSASVSSPTRREETPRVARPTIEVSGIPTVQSRETDERAMELTPLGPPDEESLCSTLTHLVKMGCSLPSVSSGFIEDLDVHVAIIGVTQGWQQVKRMIQLDPQWDYVIGMDNVLAPLSRPAERLASIYVLRQGIKYFTATDEHSQSLIAPNVPSFLKRRPFQTAIKHAEIFDYLPWPGFREYAICRPERYSTDSFFRHMLNHSRFLWPHGTSDGYLYDTTTAMLRFSKDFRDRIANIRCWTMRRDFFHGYPELRPEIPAYEASLTLYQLGNVPPSDSIVPGHAWMRDASPMRSPTLEREIGVEAVLDDADME